MEDVPPSEAKQQAEATKAARAADFREVFGGKQKTPAQIRVLEYLETFGDDERNSFDFRAPKDGLSIIAAGIHLDGAKSIIRVIKRNLSHADTVKKPKVKAQVKR